MTLGEKIRSARSEANLTQEQLAEKLLVSRAAIAKWESDRGMPDVANLQALARMFGVSVDALIGGDEALDRVGVREAYDLSAYGKGLRKTRKDRMMRERYPEATLITLIAEKQETKAEKIVDNALGFLTDAPFGIPQLLHQIGMLDREFYLLETGSLQQLIVVSDEFIETHRLHEPVDAAQGRRFTLGEYRFTSCGPVRKPK